MDAPCREFESHPVAPQGRAIPFQTSRPIRGEPQSRGRAAHNEEAHPGYSQGGPLLRFPSPPRRVSPGKGAYIREPRQGFAARLSGFPGETRGTVAEFEVSPGEPTQPLVTPGAGVPRAILAPRGDRR